MHTYAISPIHPDDISARDLRNTISESLTAVSCYCIAIDGEANAAEAIELPEMGRVGIWLGGDSEWADYDDIEQAVDDFLNNGERFASRN